MRRQIMKRLIPFLISFLFLIGCEIPAIGDEDSLKIENEQEYEQDEEENERDDEGEEDDD